MRNVCHKRFVELWNQGVTTREIALVFGVSAPYISQYAKKHRDECPIRKQALKTKVDSTEFAHMWNSEQPVELIAKKQKICKNSVYHYASQNKETCKKRTRGNTKRRSKIIHEEFVKLWNDGVTVIQIAQRFGCCKQRVSQYAQKYPDECVKRSVGKRMKKGAIIHEEFIRLWNEGVSIKKLAKRFGASGAIIKEYALMHENECPKRSQGKVKYEKFEKMWNNRVPAAEIAKEFGISLKHVYNYAVLHKNRGLKRKREMD